MRWLWKTFFSKAIEKIQKEFLRGMPEEEVGQQVLVVFGSSYSKSLVVPEVPSTLLCIPFLSKLSRIFLCLFLKLAN